MQSANYDSPVTVQGNSSGEAIPVTVTGTVADGAAVGTTKPTLIGGIDGSGNAQTILTGTDGRISANVFHWVGTGMTAPPSAGSDTLSNTVTAPRVYADNYVFDGTQWLRARGTTRGATVVDNAGYSASATFTPAASSHVTPDVVGGAQLFDLNAPASCVFEIQSASLLINNATIETTAWTLHLYSVTPPSALADDATFDIPSGDQASYLGFISLAQVVDYGSTLYIESNNIGKRVQLAASGDLFGYLVNGTTLTPGAVAHVVKIVGKVV